MTEFAEARAFGAPSDSGVVDYMEDKRLVEGELVGPPPSPLEGFERESYITRLDDPTQGTLPPGESPADERRRLDLQADEFYAQADRPVETGPMTPGDAPMSEAVGADPGGYIKAGMDPFDFASGSRGCSARTSGIVTRTSRSAD